VEKKKKTKQKENIIAEKELLKEKINQLSGNQTKSIIEKGVQRHINITNRQLSSKPSIHLSALMTVVTFLSPPTVHNQLQNAP